MVKRMMRCPEVCQALGRCRSSLYADIAEGLLPAPVRIGKRCSGWPANEIEQIQAARIRGESDDGICALVAEIMAARADAGLKGSTFGLQPYRAE